MFFSRRSFSWTIRSVHVAKTNCSLIYPYHPQLSFRVGGQMRRWWDGIHLLVKVQQPKPIHLNVSSFRLLPRGRDHDPRDPLHQNNSTFANHSITQFALFTQKAQAGQNTFQPEAAFLPYICFYSQCKNCLWWHQLASLSLTKFTDTKYQEALMSY